jgi:hypothetical protein
MFIEVDSPAISLFLYQGGKVVFSEGIAKTENFIKDVEALLAKAKEDFVLPTRVIMYDSTKLEEESHELLTHKWGTKLFIQIPKIEVLTEEDINSALIFGAKKQIFKSIANLNEAHEYMNEDSVEAETKQTTPNRSVEKPQVKAAVSGFVIGKDIREEEKAIEYPIVDDAIIDEEEDDNRDIADISSFAPSSQIQKRSMSSMFTGLSMPKVSFNGFGNMNIVLFVVGGIALLVVALFTTLYFLHTATLTILYQPNKINKKVTIKDIPVDKKSKTFSESASITTTGTKEVGEKAKGDITIYNALETEQTIPSGTKFTADGNKTFVLEKALSIKPASQTITSEGNILTTTSKTDSSLVAQEIGPEFNIKKDTEFTIEGKNKKDVFAKSKSAFEGGTKENMQAVSETDYETINDSINEKLDKKAADAAQSEGKTSVIKDATSIDINQEKYSHKVGDEADTLDLSVEAKVTFFTYKDEEVKNKIIAQFSKNTQDNQAFKPENISYEISKAELSEKEDSAEIRVNARAESSFEVNEKELVEALKGKSRSDMRKILQGNFNAAGYEMNVKTPLPLLTGTVPFFAKNITVVYRPI